MNLEADKNGVNGNSTNMDKLDDHNLNNNEPRIVNPKAIGSPKKTVMPITTGNVTKDPSVVITVQPAKNRSNDVVERPYRSQRRSSDFIDSVGMDIPRSPAGRRGSADVFFSGTSPSDRGYSSSPSSQSSPMKIIGQARRRIPDTIDAAMTGNSQPEETNPSYSDPMGIATVEALMPVEKDSDEYNMNHPRRGRAVVFNNDEFDVPGMGRRDGSDIDVKNLEKMFTALGFELSIYHNKKFQEIRTVIECLAVENHSDADCVVVTVLSHGMGTGYILAKDCPYRVECLWHPFTADNCPSLAGKPKLFFIQACRGENLDPGVNLMRRRSRTETDSGPDSYKIPTHADFLLAFSSVEGFYSFRNPDTGTWFIQCLCDEILENAHRLDLLKLLTRTARKVALYHESYNDLVPWQHEQKQVPAINSMLIREVYFRPKE